MEGQPLRASPFGEAWDYDVYSHNVKKRSYFISLTERPSVPLPQIYTVHLQSAHRCSLSPHNHAGTRVPSPRCTYNPLSPEPFSVSHTNTHSPAYKQMPLLHMRTDAQRCTTLKYFSRGSSLALVVGLIHGYEPLPLGLKPLMECANII